MLLDDAVDLGQPQTRSLTAFLSRKKRLKKMGPHLGRDTAAGVGHLQPDPTAWLHPWQRRLLAGCQFQVGQRDLQFAPLRHGVAGINGQIHQSLLQSGRISRDQVFILFPNQVNDNRFRQRAPQELDYFGHKRQQVQL
jgi:hypothetical protein